MLCRDASVPVANVDHATGEIDGHAVSRFEKTPRSASFFRCGRRPASMSLRAIRGSNPSSPITTTRSYFEGPRLRPNTARNATLNGQIAMIPNARKNVPSSTSSDPAAANPAPGPM
jgi:hypothetical protein